MSAPKPMLACKDWAFEDIKFPVYVQPKYDGVRALVKDGVVYGRSGKPIKNKWDLGKLVKFKYFDHGGKDKPRHPVFITMRDEDDLSND
jgi:hypothetical protein